MQEKLSSTETRPERQRLQVLEPPESPQERLTGLFGDEKTHNSEMESLRRELTVNRLGRE